MCFFFICTLQLSLEIIFADTMKGKSILNWFQIIAQRTLHAILLKSDNCIIMISEHYLKYIMDMGWCYQSIKDHDFITAGLKWASSLLAIFSYWKSKVRNRSLYKILIRKTGKKKQKMVHLFIICLITYRDEDRRGNKPSRGAKKSFSPKDSSGFS